MLATLAPAVGGDRRHHGADAALGRSGRAAPARRRIARRAAERDRDPLRRRATSRALAASSPIVVAGSIFLLGDVIRARPAAVISFGRYASRCPPPHRSRRSCSTCSVVVVSARAALFAPTAARAGADRRDASVRRQPSSDQTRRAITTAARRRRRDRARATQDMQLSADAGRVLRRRAPARRHRQRRLRHERQPHRRRAGRLQHRRPTGTFYNASGIATSASDERRSERLIVRHGQEPDVYFFGETIEKLGAEEIPDHATAASRTCVQPTPRWDLVAGHGRR